MRKGALLLLLLIASVGCGDRSQAGPAPSRPPEAPPAPVADPAGDAPGVLVIGIDSASWTAIDELGKDRLPNLTRLQAEGLRGSAETLLPTLSPNIWTTIATGKPPEQHGIQSFITRQVMALPIREHSEFPRGPSPMTSNYRKVKAVWNIASDHDIACAVFGWWITWPAERVKGLLVSDRVFQRKLPGRTYPESEAPAIDAVADATTPPLATPKGVDLVTEDQKLVEQWSRSDRFYADLAKKSLDDPDRKLVMVYLRGLDPVSHRFWKYWKTDGYRIPESDRAALGDVVPGYYAYVDGLVGELCEHRGKRAVLVLSDHGMTSIIGTTALLDPVKLLTTLGETPSAYEISGDFLADNSSVRIAGSGDLGALAARLRAIVARSSKRPLFRAVLEVKGPPAALLLTPERSFPPGEKLVIGNATATVAELGSPPPPGAHSGVHEQSPEGIYLLVGGSAPAGKRLQKVSVYHACPTILTLLGLPLADDMPGRFTEGWPLAKPRSVPTYETGEPRVAPGPIDTEYDDDYSKELRQLGYLM
ncbi:MAG: alkaline phosphatase family protein [Acidobacteriota bacterium]